jgi:hypothetical protein
MKRCRLIDEGRPEEFEALAAICPVFRFDRRSQMGHVLLLMPPLLAGWLGLPQRLSR